MTGSWPPIHFGKSTNVHNELDRDHVRPCQNTRSSGSLTPWHGTLQHWAIVTKINQDSQGSMDIERIGPAQHQRTPQKQPCLLYGRIMRKKVRHKKKKQECHWDPLFVTLVRRCHCHRHIGPAKPCCTSTASAACWLSFAAFLVSDSLWLFAYSPRRLAE